MATPAGGTIATVLVASQVDRDAGQLPVPTLPAGPPPQTAPSLTAVALDGGGVADGSIALGQTVLVTAQFPTSASGAWVRIWPLGFDPATGLHIRLDGGAAPVDQSGAARIVLPLPDGTVVDPSDGDAAPRLGVDLLIVTQGGQTLFPDLRIDRPFPAATNARIALELGNSAAAHLRNRRTASGRAPEWQRALRLRGRRTRRDTTAAH